MPETNDESLVSSIESWTTDSLNELREDTIKKAVNEIINKDSWLFSETKRKLLEKYLIKDWTASEGIEDYFLEEYLLQNTISDQIRDFKEKVYNAQSIEELDRIKNEILENIDADSSITDTDNSTTTASTTAATAGAATTQGNWYTSSRRESTTHRPRTSSTEHYSIDNFYIEVSKKYEDLYNKLKWPELPDLEPFACAMKWYDEMKSSLKNPKYLTVVDFTKPNNQNRFYVINMTNNTIEYATTVWHGSWSWRWEYATSFSDVNGSHQTSLGFYRTPDEITKPNTKKRNWLLMRWIEDSNDSAQSRWIYMHPWGSISQWCFTLPKDQAYEIMNKLKWDSLLFAYAKSNDYFAQSEYFDSSSNWDVAVA